ncbi:hypothetical protein FQR65_LT20829 [Abscondita terminalis]|nr:hypothetical protein FQR65_LT20829 [Abscondita terminalis]
MNTSAHGRHGLSGPGARMLFVLPTAALVGLQHLSPALDALSVASRIFAQPPQSRASAAASTASSTIFVGLLAARAISDARDSDRLPGPSSSSTPGCGCPTSCSVAGGVCARFPYLYEAAEIDRASEVEQILHVDAPACSAFIVLADALSPPVEKLQECFDLVDQSPTRPGSVTELASIGPEARGLRKMAHRLAIRAGHHSLRVESMAIRWVAVRVLERSSSDERRHPPFPLSPAVPPMVLRRGRGHLCPRIAVPLVWSHDQPCATRQDAIAYPTKVGAQTAAIRLREPVYDTLG